MNDSAPVNKTQGQPTRRGINVHTLDTLSLAALIPLSQAVFDLADTPMIILSRLHDLVCGLYNQNREQDAIDLLYIVFGMLGTEYADAVLLLRAHTAFCFIFGGIKPINAKMSLSLIVIVYSPVLNYKDNHIINYIRKTRIFNAYFYSSAPRSFLRTRFFNAGHEVLLQDGIHIRSSDDFDKMLQEEKQKILSDPKLLKRFEQIDKKIICKCVFKKL